LFFGDARELCARPPAIAIATTGAAVMSVRLWETPAGNLETPRKDDDATRARRKPPR
jgi:hypothetical protein